MLKRITLAVRTLVRNLRGENLEAITKESNKQISKLEKAIQHLEQDAKDSIAQSQALEVAALNAKTVAQYTKVKKAKASVVKHKLEYLFTATPDEISKALD